jgi:ubiquinone/menaquinone biosynthesis C-methylase UbiE
MDKRWQNEIEHGKYLSEHGAAEIWNWNSPAGVIRRKRRVEILTAGITPEMFVLELGCGSGLFTAAIANTGANLVAIDISPELLQEAVVNVKAANVTFRQENACDLKFADASFDAVIGSSVLHHLDLARALAEIYRVLKPGGFVTFTEPNMMNPQIALQKNIPWLKRLLGDSPDETAFFSWRIRRQLINFGFNSVSVKPFDFLHPATPSSFIPIINPACNWAESIPLVRSIAGSLIIKCRK